MPFKTALENMPQPSLLDASAINNYYSSVGIQSLSPSQIRRLKKGHNVRVKLGTAHNIHLSPDQIKKLHAAAKKGKAITVVFDPIQIQNHGSGVFGNISGKCGSKGCKGKGVVSDVFHTAGNVSKAIGLGVARKHTSAPKKRGIKKGKGFLGELGNIAKTGALSVAQQGIDTGASYLNNKINGMGVVPHRRIVGRRSVNKKKSHGGSGCGGSLYPAGYTP